MYKRIYLVFLFTVGFVLLAGAQEMNKGFQYLEKGNFDLAEIFFKDVLKSYPNNKTARLCYARATGLNGQPKQALLILNELGLEYPKDFEIQLNYAEALLWNKDYLAAETYYKNLLDINKESFPAVLGYANTLSSLKKYKTALNYVNNALELLPNNSNAQVSKKYIQLGLANDYLKTKEYEASILLLKDNLNMFPGDNETLLSLANTHIIEGDYEAAALVYNQLTGSDKENIQSMLGLSLLAHLNGNESKALELSNSMLNQQIVKEDSILEIQVKQRYVQALIWNGLYKDAEVYLSNLPANRLNQNWALGLRAMLHVYKRDFNKSIALYKLMLENDSSSFDGNLGLANAYKAVDKYDEAYIMALQTLSFYENQKDALNFIKQLEYMFYPTLETTLKYSFDNGDNESYTWSNKIIYPYTSKFALKGSYSYRKTFNDITAYKASVNYGGLGFNYRFINTVVLKTNVGVSAIQLENYSYNQFQAKIALDIKPVKLQQLTLGYSRELEDFNAQLIDERITKDIFFLNHNLNTNVKLGWFNQYYYTSQNDGNTRHLFFTSLYYTLLNKPVVKTGINYQYITFGKDRSSVYFSPSKFNMVEVFGELIKRENAFKGKCWNYGVNAAVGYQFIEDQSAQATYRVKLDLGYVFSDRFSGGVYYQKSNIASGNTGGFSFTEFGIKLRWVLAKKSVFKHIKNED